MVIAAALYAPIEIAKTDREYSVLIDKGEKALHNYTEARERIDRFTQLLYKEVLQPDEERRLTDTDVDRVAAEYNALSRDALVQSPGLTRPVEKALALFNQAVSDAHAVRLAALAHDDQKALQLLRGIVDPELERARQASANLIQRGAESVNTHSDDLTAATHRVVVVLWLILAFGLIPGFVLGVYVF